MDDRLRRKLHEETARADRAEALAEERRLEIVQLHAKLDELLTLAAAQNERLSELQQILRRLTDKKRKKSQKDQPPSGDSEADPAKQPGEAGSGSAASTDQGPPPPPIKEAKERKPRPKGAGRRPPPEGLREVTTHSHVCACSHCGGTNLLARNRESTPRIDAEELMVRLRHDVVDVVVCQDCGRPTTAPPPSLPCEKSKFTCGFLAWLVTMRFVALVPPNRIRRILVRQGVDIPHSTMVHLFEVAADLASAVDGAHWKQLMKKWCIQTDGTGLKTLVGLPEAWDSVLDVVTDGETYVYYFALTKYGSEIVELLGHFEGVLMCDAESRLNEICRQALVRRANCNAHARRKFRDAEIAQPELARVGGRFLTRMYAVERRAQKDGLEGLALLAVRQQKIRPIVDEFRAWLLAQEAVLLPKDPLGGAVRYYLRHFTELTLFVDDPAIPIDNNACERAFQDHARLRLNSLFAGSPEGGHRWAILLGVVTTAVRCGLDIQAYLTWMFERRGTRKREYGLTAAQLTPAAYKQMSEEQRRKVA